MENELKSGVIEDTRSSTDKAKDYQASDLAMGVLLNWKEKTPSEWKKYIPREQNGSLSCVAQSCAKGMEVMLYDHVTFVTDVQSAHPIYRLRSNFSSGGMFPQNCGAIAKNNGTTTELLDQSQFQNEETMNRDITVATPTKVGGYVFYDHKDIDSIAEAVATHGHCMLLIRCNKSEWTGIPEYKGDVVNFNHEITAVDYFLNSGIKYIEIEDSTGHWSSLDGNGQRLLSSDFLIARCDNAMSLTPLPPKPNYIFTKTLRIGSVGTEVRMLQLKLNIGADGLFGKKTKAAAITFQLKNGLKGDGIVGPLTRIKLNLN